jgi:hypothetical protein
VVEGYDAKDDFFMSNSIVPVAPAMMYQELTVQSKGTTLNPFFPVEIKSGVLSM